MRHLLCSALCALFLASPTAAEITLPTATGPVTLAENPQSVAVFDVAAIDTLDALGIALAGVPDRVFVPYLDHVSTGAATVGTLFEPDFEALVALSPALIIVGARMAAQTPALSRLAPVIDMTIPAGGTVEQARARIGAYGALFGVEERAAHLLRQLDDRILVARRAVANKGKALIILTNGAKVSAYGANSRFGWLHGTLGLPEAAANLEAQTHGQAVSFEFITQVDPDWLLVVDRGAAIGQTGAAAATLDNPLIARTRAAQQGQIVYLDAAPLYVAGGGAQSPLRTLDELITAFGAAGG